MLKTLGVAIGAGVASALLFTVSATPSVAAMLLAYLTPLPIMIAALGFGHVSGGIAALSAAFAVAAIVGPLAGAVFLVVLGAPAWILGYLALMARPVEAAGTPATEWYPVARLAVWMSVLSALPVLCIGAVVLLRYGGYENALAVLADRLGPALRGLPLPTSFSASSIVRAAPVAMATSTFLMLAINLWAAGRVVLLSQRLPRPWPAVADGLRLPLPAIGCLAGAIAAAFLPDPLGLAASVIAAALGIAFVLSGLAAAHVLTHGLTVRRLILGAIYGAVVVFMPWPLLALALLGGLDCLFPLRSMFRSSPSKPGS